MPTGNPKPLSQIQNLKPRIYNIGEEVSLSKPGVISSRSFFEVISERRSVRKFSGISLQQISTILWYSAKVKTAWMTENQQIRSHRPVPSAGAIHPIDIFISPPDIISQRKLFYYDPFSHRLNVLNSPAQSIIDFFAHINESINIKEAAIFWTVIDIQRTAAVYENPESLAWRDSGALLGAIQLVANAIGIGSCILGTLAEPHIYKVLESSRELLSCGGLALGNGQYEAL